EEGSGVAEPARAQLESDERGEGRLRGTTLCPASPHRLAKRQSSRHRRSCLADHLVYPAFDQRQHRLQTLKRCSLRRGLLDLEQATVQRFLYRLDVARVDGADRVLDPAGVNGDAAAVILDQRADVIAQPLGM